VTTRADRKQTIATVSRRIEGPVTLTRPVGALRTNEDAQGKVAVQLAPGTSVLPVGDAEADGMIDVRTSDSEVYTIFESDLVDDSTPLPMADSSEARDS
jgi:hypothetical protein